MVPVAAGAHTGHVRIRLGKSQEILASDLPAWVEAGYWCEMTIYIEPDALRATPCVKGRRLGSYSFDD